MNIKLQFATLLACMALGAGGWAAPGKPQPMGKDAYEAEKARIVAQSKRDRKACDALHGRREDICEAEARGRADALLAELEARYQPSPDAWLKAKNVTAEANYRVAKLKCGALEGRAERRCVREAKAAREAAERQAKVEKVQETGGPFARRAAKGDDS